MTRKDELAQLALNYLHQHHKTKRGLPINCDAKCLTELLQQVEREVWGKAITILDGGRFLADSSEERKWANSVIKVLRQQQERG